MGTIHFERQRSMNTIQAKQNFPQLAIETASSDTAKKKALLLVECFQFFVKQIQLRPGLWIKNMDNSAVFALAMHGVPPLSLESVCQNSWA